MTLRQWLSEIRNNAKNYLDMEISEVNIEDKSGNNVNLFFVSKELNYTKNKDNTVTIWMETTPENEF